MELRQIEFFLQLYKDRNITVASQNLYISQQGMSKSIANLEKEVGFPLFKRSVSGVKPTVEACELYSYFRTVMKSYAGLQKKVNDIEMRKNGVLSIVWPEFFALACEKEEYATFSGQNPGIQISVMEESEEMGIHLLREGLADVAFMYAPIPKDLESHIIVEREPLCAVIKRENPLAEKENIDIEDLVEHALIFSSGNNITRKNIIKKAKETAGEELELIPISYTQMLHAVYTKDCIALAPENAFRYINFPELVYKPVKFKGQDFYELECHLVTVKRENYKAEIERYIAHEKESCKRRFL
nr:LysR family transcriptional regulator [uncultured Anaerobutyricum sp.]